MDQPTSDAEHAAYRLPLGAQLFRCSLEQDFAFGQDNMPFGKIADSTFLSPDIERQPIDLAQLRSLMIEEQ